MLAEPEILARLKAALSDRFPIEEWTDKEFEYIGCKYRFTKEAVYISQEHYAESRVDYVSIPTGQKDDDEAATEQREENRICVGSLSWLARQTRPDLQFAVSADQRRQNRPTVGDLKATNRIVKLAKEHKAADVVIRKIEENNMAILGYHDAAWGNVPDPAAETGDERWLGQHTVSSQLAYLVVMIDRRGIDGAETPFSLLDWRSKASPRVCRSTFAGIYGMQRCNGSMLVPPRTPSVHADRKARQ